MDERSYYVYILSNKTRCLYIGVTNSIRRRVFEHKQHLLKGFTYRYNIDQLVYYEYFQDVHCAIAREKRLKCWPRKWKEHLIESLNPEWKDLAKDWFTADDFRILDAPPDNEVKLSNKS